MRVFRIELTEEQWDALQHEYFRLTQTASRAPDETDSDIIEAALPFDVCHVEGEDSELADELIGFVKRMAD